MTTAEHDVAPRHGLPGTWLWIAALALAAALWWLVYTQPQRALPNG